MLKLIIFSVVLLALCIADISIMRKEGLKREIIPYALLAAAAVVTAIAVFTDPLRGGALHAALRLMGAG